MPITGFTIYPIFCSFVGTHQIMGTADQPESRGFESTLDQTRGFEGTQEVMDLSNRMDWIIWASHHQIDHMIPGHMIDHMIPVEVQRVREENLNQRGKTGQSESSVHILYIDAFLFLAKFNYP